MGDDHTAKRGSRQLEGQLVFDDGRNRLPCVIMAIGKGGARLFVDHQADLPSKSEIVASDGRSWGAYLIWRGGNDASLAFEQPHRGRGLSGVVVEGVSARSASARE